MYLTIGQDGDLALEEIDDFKRFHIAANADRLVASEAFAAISEDAGEAHYWLDADAVVALSSAAGDADWTGAFEAMLEKAEPYGYADLGGRRIKAHVVAPDTA